MLIPQESATLSSEQEIHLRQYRRLWLTEIDLEEAKGAINEIIKRDLRRTATRSPTPLLQSLTTALVIAYARPFTMSRGNAAFADRTVPGALLRVFSSSERQFHNQLIEIRNKEVAHSDADVTKVTLELIPDGHGGISMATRSPLSRPELRMLLSMIGKLEGELHIRFEALRAKLPLNVWL
jgi:hypothetical protein